MTPADVELAEDYITEVERLRRAIAEVIVDLEAWFPSRSSNLVLEKLRAALDEGTAPPRVFESDEQHRW